MFEAAHILTLNKDGERYLWIFDDHNRDATLRHIARDAANPELSLSWYDAAVLSRKVRKTTTQEEIDEEASSQQNHSQVTKLAAAMEASYVGKRVDRCRQPRNRFGHW
jgi:hypothetical protein